VRAHLSLARGDTEAALAEAREAVAILAEDRTEQGSAYHALALAEAARRQVDAAAASFKNAVERLEQGAEWREALAAYRAWSRMLRAAGRDQEALDVADRATAVSIRTLAWRN
jgi:tetratricopeptide (TPR) repeat protein